MAEELNKVSVDEPGLLKQPVNTKKPLNPAHIIVYFIGGVLEVLLLFRLVFKMSGADPTSGFVSFIYGVTNFFVAPYANFVLEPGTLVAMLVYAVLAWGVAKIVTIALGRFKK